MAGLERRLAEAALATHRGEIGAQIAQHLAAHADLMRRWLTTLKVRAAERG